MKPGGFVVIHRASFLLANIIQDATLMRAYAIIFHHKQEMNNKKPSNAKLDLSKG